MSKKVSEQKRTYRKILIETLKLIPDFFAVTMAVWGGIRIMYSEVKSDAIYLETVLWVLGAWSVAHIIDKIVVSAEIIKSAVDVKALHREVRDILGEIRDDKMLVDDARTFEQNWDVWKRHLLEGVKEKDEKEYLTKTWSELKTMYLAEENKRLQNGCIKSTSEIYTRLVSQVTEILHKETHKDKWGKLARLHITGMLPEEFFNGPQIEYVTWDKDNSPIIFCHAFEGPEYRDSHYKAQETLKSMENLQVRRCFLVKENSFVPEQFMALSTLSSLKEQFALAIHGSRPLSLARLTGDDPLAPLVLDRLFSKCRDKVNEFIHEQDGRRDKDFIHRVVNFHKYSYFPIVNRDKLNHAGDKDFTPLITFFAKFFSRVPDDLFYYPIKGDVESEGPLGRYFKTGSGWPEITLFGFLPSGQREDDWKSVKWLMGIKGDYTPLTRQMEIEIVRPAEAEDLITNMSAMLSAATMLSTLAPGGAEQTQVVK
jgi:hypothetical protein